MTYAGFKKMASDGNIALELLEWFGKTENEIPERMRGLRKVSKTVTYGFVLENKDGQTSRLEIRSAKLFEYDGETVTVYNPGQRDQTEQERRVVEKWKAIEEDYYKRNPYGDSYWKMKDYFENCPCPWMAGFQAVKGKYLLYNGKVQDNQLKGEAILKYKVHILEESENG